MTIGERELAQLSAGAARDNITTLIRDLAEELVA
jgi:hypothetical protein